MFLSPGGLKKGGKGIAVFCDHSDPKDIKKLFDKIEKENNGQLDLLVNNAYAAVNYIFKNTGKKFYELEPENAFEIVNNVGLKNHYICSTFAARLMIPRKSGLIVTVSSTGGMGYLFNIPYGIGKSAYDRLAADIAVDLAPHQVASIALWPGAVKTELVQEVILKNQNSTQKTKDIFEHGETTNFSGKCIVQLLNDKNILESTGKILNTPDLGQKYNIFDEDGKQPKVFPEKVKKYLDFINETRDWRLAKENAKL
ncbi:hypothetical protein FO519_006890 [Halicephalobus sp. NKZ332]|nr:hypothetical protein FO519_006890 [Halicephalobus sp. NKZ332]